MDDSRKPAMVSALCITLTVSFVAVSMRAYTRAVLIGNFSLDDWCCVVAFLVTLACGILIGLNLDNGLGLHQSILSTHQLIEYRKLFYFSVIIYNIALIAIKATFILQYYRALPVQKARRVYMIILGFICAWGLSQILVQIFVCNPVSYFWTQHGDGSCIPTRPWWYANAAGNIATDLVIIIIPLPILLKLKLGFRQKLVLVVLFSLGLFTCAISLIRIRFLDQSKDTTWINVKTAAWSMAELGCGLLCACVPTLRPLASRYIPSILSRSRSLVQKHHSATAHGNGGDQNRHSAEIPEADEGKEITQPLPPTSSQGSDRPLSPSLRSARESEFKGQ